MGKAKVIEEEVPVDKKALKDAKKAAKKDVKQALKALHLDREPPAYVDAHDADAFLLACGLPVSKLATLKVNFGERLVSRGDLFSKTKAAHRFLHDEPVVSWEGDGEHTVIMFDADAPEREGDGSTPGKRGPWLHWLISGCKGSTADCKSLTDYLPPSPGVGCHRFIFLLFKGAIPLVKSDERICWDVAKFMNVHPNLVPVAMDFMYVTSV